MRYGCPMRLALLLAVSACAPTIGSEGSSVTLRGRVGGAAQHFVRGVPGKSEAFFDYAPDRKVLIYWKDPPTCSGEIEIEGTVIVESGRTKRPGSTEVMQMDAIDVHRVRCVD